MRYSSISSSHTLHENDTLISGSDIISLSIFGQRVIVLNSARAVNDLLEKRSGQYSNKCALS